MHVKSDRACTSPYCLKPIMESDYVLDPLWSVILIGGTVHQDIREVLLMQRVLFVGLNDPVASERAIQ